MVTKTLILSHCHFGCIDLKTEFVQCTVKCVTIKTVICHGDSSTPGSSLHPGSMLSPPQCLRGSSTSGPQFKWTHCPTVPSNIPRQCSVWGNTSFRSFLGCLPLSQLTDHPSSWSPALAIQRDGLGQFWGLCYFYKWHYWYQEENQIISLLPFIGEPLFLLDQASSLFLSSSPSFSFCPFA